MQEIQALFTPEGIQNPYPHYDAIRAASPLLYIPEWNSVFVTGHPEASLLLRESKVSVERMMVRPEDLAKPEFMPVNALYHMMLFRDPPDHTRLRSLVSQAFTKKGLGGKPTVFSRLRPERV